MLSKFKTVFLFLLVQFIFGAAGAMAQKQASDSASTRHDLKEVVIDGHLMKRQRSAMPVQEFSAKEIKLLNATNISDVAKHLTGVMVRDYGGIGGVKTISVRGLGAAHTGVSYDGAMINDIQTGQIDLGKFSIENIAEVTLSNGQPNDFFQPARMFASASVLSFNSSALKNDSTNPFSAKVTLKAGSFGLINPFILLNKGFAKRWVATVAAEGTTANGEYQYEEDLNRNGIGPSAIIEKTRINGDVHSLKSEVQLIGQLQEFETFSFKTNIYYNERGLPGPDTYDSNYSKDRMLDKVFVAQAHYKNKQSCYFQYQVQGSANRSFMRYTSINPKYNTRSDNTLIDEYMQDEYFLSATTQYYPFKKLALTSAIDWIFNDLTSTSNTFEQYNAKPVRNTILANVAAKYFTTRLTIGANLLYTATHESTTEQAAPNRNKFSPTVSLSYKILEDQDLRVRGYYKNVFRMPTFAELYYHNFGYSALRPEITNQYDLGLIYYCYKTLFLSDLELSVDGYYNEVTDKITIRYGIPYASVQNVGQVCIKGVDVGLKTRIKLNQLSGFNIRINYAHQSAQDRTQNSQNYGEQIPYTPFNSSAGSFGYYNKAFETGYNLIYSGVRWDGPNVKDNKLYSYAEHSVYAKCNFKKAMLMGEVINLMNTQYEIIKTYPMPGRNYRLTLSYSF